MGETVHAAIAAELEAIVDHLDSDEVRYGHALSNQWDGSGWLGGLDYVTDLLRERAAALRCQR